VIIDYLRNECSYSNLLFKLHCCQLNYYQTNYCFLGFIELFLQQCVNRLLVFSWISFAKFFMSVSFRLLSEITLRYKFTTASSLSMKMSYKIKFNNKPFLLIKWLNTFLITLSFTSLHDSVIRKTTFFRLILLNLSLILLQVFEIKSYNNFFRYVCLMV